jgi:hypothetical protein
VLALEGQRGTLGIVLVIGSGPGRGRCDAGEFPLQRGHPLQCALPLRQQHLPRARHAAEHSRSRLTSGAVEVA